MTEILIKISDDDYEWMKMGSVSNQGMKRLYQAIKNGTPLPKGHGNLIQREDAEAIFKNARRALLEQSRKEKINDLQTRELMLLNAEQFVHLIQPIIEVDKEGVE